VVLHILIEDINYCLFIYTKGALHHVILVIPTISVVTSMLLSQQQLLFGYDVAKEKQPFEPLH